VAVGARDTERMVTVRAVRAHEIPTRWPIQVTPGQRVDLGDRDVTWPEFVFVTTDTGSGWVPARHIEPGPDASGVVQTAYDTTELPTMIGDELTVLETDEISGWTRVRNVAGREGWVPDSTIEPVPPA
jgi:SH3-like domain-containing protein